MLEVCLAEYEEDERKEQAERDSEDPNLTDGRKSPKLPDVKKKKGGPPAMATLTAPQKIRDEIKNLCKLLHNIPAVKGTRTLTLTQINIPAVKGLRPPGG